MSFQYSVSLNDPTGSPLDSSVLALANTAAAKWSSYISGMGSIDIQFIVNSTPTSANGYYANGGWTASAAVGSDNGHTVFESGAAYELATGNDLNGTQPDIVVHIDPNFQNLQLDPNASPSANQIDGLGLFEHEIAHGLGFGGFRDKTTGALGTNESIWDKLTTIASDGTAYFTGATAEAIYGSAVPETSIKNGEQYAHVSNSASDRVANDLMTGLFFHSGQKYAISDLDLAILKDMGLDVTAKVGDYPTVAANVPGLNNVYRFYQGTTGDHFYTTDFGERGTIQNTSQVYKFEGTPWATPDKAANTIDTFRFYDTHTGDHFYTTSANERDTILQTPGTNYQYEGIGFEVYANEGAAGTFALERFYNTQSGQHHFATLNEADGIRNGSAGANWVDEGKAFVVHDPAHDVLFA